MKDWQADDKKLSRRIDSLDENKLGATEKAADSELLDGLDSSLFVYGQTSAASTSIVGGDADDIVRSGFYSLSPTTLNNPTAAWVWMSHMEHKDLNGYGYQIGTSQSSTNPLLYMRVKAANVYGPWFTMMRTNDTAANSTLLNGQASSYYLNNAQALLEIGSLGTGDRYSAIDFHADDTNTDHSMRLIRNPGVNGACNWTNIGTGSISIQGQTNIYNKIGGVTKLLADSTGVYTDGVLRSLNHGVDNLGGVSNVWKYVYATYFNCNHAQTTRNADTIFYSSTDAFIRKNTAAGFRTSLDVYSKAESDAAAAGGGGLESIQIFTTTGADTWTKPAGITKVKVTVIGGGGGAGGAGATYGSVAGGGGGSGIKWIDVSAISSETLAIGAGGAGNTGSGTGTAGGTSSFGAHVSCTGGGGGASSVATTANSGAGGVATGGDMNITGGNGRVGTNDANGGDSIFSHGGINARNTGSIHGTSATGYGGGGGGASPSGGNGGSGSDGIIIVEEYK